MCRLALVDNLANHLGDKHKDLFYEAVFALVPDEKEAADSRLAKAGLWPAVDAHLQDITVADPACGSGSFLVGMLHVLDDLQARAAPHVGRTESAYDRRKRIIGRSLYGVDVMEWACRVAELRLWLALIIEAEFTAAEVHQPKDDKPLLPNFSFKVRCGDSLVQEVGGIQLGHRRGSTDIPKSIKNRLRKLQNDKLAYYAGDRDPKFKTEAAIRGEEVKIFHDLLGEQTKNLENRAKGLMRQQAGRPVTKGFIEDDAGTQEDIEKVAASRARREEEIKRLMAEAERLSAVRQSMLRPEDVPFVWDIAFAEVMESDAGGFDIVIGNPPYVNDENIANPALPQDRVTATSKREYKAGLARAVYHAWPRFFGYKPSSDAPGRKMDAKSDLYVYFYFHGLSLLAEKGAFCFITSNSWLDVGYGKDLQEFLLRHGHARMVIDNQVKRSFKEAYVNTVMVLLARPDDAREEGPKRTARFVMFKVPFDQVLSPVVFEEIEEAAERKSTTEYRVCPLGQAKLLAEGGERMPEEEARTEESPAAKTKPAGPLIKVARYIGNKWGGRYLRAPDIYWYMLERHAESIAPLGSVMKVWLGAMTGYNPFFYVRVPGGLQPRSKIVRCINGHKHEFEIERRWLAPIVKDLGLCDSLIPKGSHETIACLNAPSDMAGLKGTLCEKYLRWGERVPIVIKQGRFKGKTVKGVQNLQFFKNRRPWWSIPSAMLAPAEVALVKLAGPVHKLAWLDPPAAIDQSFYGLAAAESVIGVASLCCTWTVLAKEIHGRRAMGGGGLQMGTLDLRRMPIISPSCLTQQSGDFAAALRRIGSRRWCDAVRETEETDRRRLDGIVFDRLKLSRGEREAIYEAVVDLVESRVKKAEGPG